MSVVNLQQVKDELRITDNDSDTHLQTLLDASLSEAASFCNTLELPSDPAVVSAVLLLVRSKYDLENADDMKSYRSVAETLLQPHRVTMGI